MAYKTKRITKNTYKADSYSLVLEQDDAAGKRVTMAVRRVMVCGKDDQLQIDVETETTSVNGNTRTAHTGMILPPEFAEQFVAACQTYWEPAR